MRLFLRDGSSHLQILPRSLVREFRDVGAAKEFLRPLLAQSGNALTAQHVLGDADDLVEQLALRIVSEGLQVISCNEHQFSAATVATQGQTTTTPLEDEQAAPKAAEPEPKHFIEIVLVDDEGKAVANEAYVVELPDGTQRTGRTDGDGKAYISGVDPGTAKVSFPDLDKTAYEPDGG